MGSKARESAEAMSLAFVLLDFQHAGVRRRAYVIHLLLYRERERGRERETMAGEEESRFVAS